VTYDYVAGFVLLAVGILLTFVAWPNKDGSARALA
jgi:hypothetical protein